jgi:hypothetical protein
MQSPLTLAGRKCGNIIALIGLLHPEDGSSALHRNVRNSSVKKETLNTMLKKKLNLKRRQVYN